MSVLLVLLGAVAALMVLVVRSLLVDEAKGQLQRCVRASVEATIAALPPALQDAWAEEWRADLEAVITMPLTALKFAYGLRRSVGELVGDSASAAESTNDETSQEAVWDDDRQAFVVLDEVMGFAPEGRMLTPTELARATGLDRRDVISKCMELGVPIFQGRIDKTLFLTSLDTTRSAP
jgi:hypothetical protein